MKSSVWLSFDLGIQGDYESLYTWLDNHGAKECGNNVAYFAFEHGGELAASLQQDLEKSIVLTPRSRFYIIYTAGGKAKGKFLFGQRKSARWTGSANLPSLEDDDNG